jgi:hypothetical protein
MVRALTRFSDDCQPPELNADCPFFQPTTDGGVCGEQCKDILAAVGGDRPAATEGLSFGDGLVLQRRRRPRPRRGPDKTKRAFDAREAHLSDRDRPRDVRSAASLIHELRMLLFEHPGTTEDPSETRYEIHATFDELARRGVNVEALVRHGLLDQLALAIPMLAALPEFGEPVDGAEHVVGQAWHELLVASHADDKRRRLDGVVDLDGLMRRVRSMALSFSVLPPLNAPESVASTDESQNPGLTSYALGGRFVSRVINWVQTAAIDDVLDWQAPPASLFVSEPITVGPSPQVVQQGRWLYDRFSKTYLPDWEPESLEHEWRWLLGRCEGAAPASVMKERPTRAEEVSACLADLATAPASAQTPALTAGEDDSAVLYNFVYLAARSLREGRRQEAITLFRGLAQLRPRDPDINNNYGFCLLVDDPESAVRWLERAATLNEGRQLDGTNLANRIYAATLLKDDERALALAEVLFTASRTQTFVSAYLWLDNGDGPVLGDDVHPLMYGATLALRAAERLGRQDAVTIWTARIADLDQAGVQLGVGE